MSETTAEERLSWMGDPVNKPWGDRIHRLMVHIEQAEAQLGEAVGRFILAVNVEAETDMKRGNPLEGAHHRALEKLGAPFLAGLTTEGPKIDFLYMTRDQSEKRDQPCERVSVCCGHPPCSDGTARCGSCDSPVADFKCSRHGCEWLDKEESCPEGAKVVCPVCQHAHRWAELCDEPGPPLRDDAGNVVTAITSTCACTEPSP